MKNSFTNIIYRRMFSSSNIRFYKNVFFYASPSRYGTINMNTVDYFTITGWMDNKITFYKFADKRKPIELLTVTFEDSIQAEKEYNNILQGNPPYTGL